MIYKTIDKFLESFIIREVSSEEDKEIFERKILEVVTYFKLLYINSGQGAFYNILSSYISDESGLHELLRKCYERHKNGRLTDEDGSVDIIIKSIFSNNFLKKFDKEAKTAIPPIVAIFFSGFYVDDETNSWLKVSRNRIIDVDVSNYEDILKLATDKDLERVGIELIEDLIEIRENENKTPKAMLLPAYLLLARGHSKFNHLRDEIKNYEKIIEIHEQENTIGSEDMIEACNRIGEILQEQGKIARAIGCFEKGLKSIIALYGFRDIRVGKQNEIISAILLLNGDFIKASKALAAVAGNYETNYGIEDKHTINIYISLADLLYDLGEFNTSYKNYTKIFGTLLRQDGNDSEHALVLKSKLALVCKRLSKVEEMQRLHNECILTIQNYFDDLHYVKGIIFTTKAEINCENRNYYKALENHENALDIYLSTIGEHNERTLKTYENIGLIYEKIDQFDEALNNYEKVYILRKSAENEENIGVVNLKEKMGNIFRLQGNFPNALSYLSEALEFKDKYFPDDHEEKLSLYINLGKLYKDTGNFISSYDFLNKALIIAKNNLDTNDPQLIEVYRNVAVLKGQNDEIEEAIEYYTEAVSRLIALDENLEVAQIYKEITELFLAKEDYDGAIEYALKSKEMTEKTVGKDDILNLDCVNLLAHVYNESGDCEDAILAYQDVCRILIEKFGKLNHNLAIAYENMSGVFVKLEKLNDAIDFLNLALTINTKIFGENSAEVSNNYSNIAFIEYLQKKHSEALMHYEKVLQINELTNSTNSTITSEIFYALGRLYSTLNEFPKALKYYKRSMVLQETVVNDLEVVIEENFLIEQCHKFEDEGKYIEAINVFSQYLAERIKKQGVGAIGKGVIYQRVAECYKNIPGSVDKLQVLYLNKSLLVKTKIYGENNPKMAGDFVDFAIANRECGDKNVALDYFKKALSVFEIIETDKENDARIAEIKLNIGMLLREQQQFSEAISMITEANAYFESSNFDRMLVWKSVTELGNTYLEADETEAALEYFEKSELICREDQYKFKGCTGITFYNLGDTYRKLNRKRDAVMYYEKTLAIEREVKGEHTFLAGALYTNIGLIYKSSGHTEKALEYFKSALSCYENSVGIEHNNYKYISILLEEVKLQLLYQEEKEVTGMARMLNIVKGY